MRHTTDSITGNLGRIISSNGAGGIMARGTMASMVVTMLSAGSEIIAEIVIARFLGIAAYGSYAYVVTVMMLLAYIG